MKLKLSIVLTAILASSTTLFAQGTLAKFQGGIGVTPISNVTVDATTGMVTVVRNNVRGVNPAGQLWVIADLKATVNVDGRIMVDGRGLVFSGGNSIGSGLASGTALNVFATLICETAAPFTQFSTNAVPLAANGDFRIDDVLSPLPPSSCVSPVLLIREAVGQSWFSAGISKIWGR